MAGTVHCQLGSSVHGIFQTRVQKWLVISLSKGSSQPRDWTRVSRIAGRRFTIWATRGTLLSFLIVEPKFMTYKPFTFQRKEWLTAKWCDGVEIYLLRCILVDKFPIGTVNQTNVLISKRQTDVNDVKKMALCQWSRLPISLNFFQLFHKIQIRVAKLSTKKDILTNLAYYNAISLFCLVSTSCPTPQPHGL